MNIVPLPANGIKLSAQHFNQTFSDFWNLGYGPRLLPIVPPDAKIRETSTLYKRVDTQQDSRGKAPGVCNAEGLWYSFDWLRHETTQDDLARWQKMGAGVGCRMGSGLAAIDADTLNKVCASQIQLTVVKHCGVTPVRIGNHPKALYLVRVSGPMPYKRVEFGDGERVEILTEGRQAVFHGVHPKTKQFYAWPFQLVPFDQLPVVMPEELSALLEELRSILPASKPIVTEGGGNEVNQASLRGDLEKVRSAVRATPNTSEGFPTRETWRDFGYAIKGALQDHPDEAFELFCEWSERWTENGQPVQPGNDPRFVETEWKRFKPPFRVGASKIFETAEQHSTSGFRRVDAWFEEIPDEPEGLFIEKSPRPLESIPRVIRPTPYSFPDPAQIPTRQWLYGTHYIRSFVSATVAPGGLGKSSLTIVEALAMVSGKPLLGVEPKGKFRVWLWNGEDPMDELNRRVAGAMKHYGLSEADVGHRLWLDSGQHLEIVLATETRGRAQVIEENAAALVSALRSNQIDALVIDPFISSHRVNENDNGAIDLVVKRLAKIAAEASVAVEIVHHVRKTNGAEVTTEDARGASSLVNAARTTRAITRMTEAEGRALGREDYWRYWRFGGVSKNNLAPATTSPAEKADWYTLKSEALGNGSGAGVDAFMTGDNIGVVVRAGLEDMPDAQTAPDQVEDALCRIGAADWRADVRAGDAWVGNPVAQAFGLDATDKSDRTRINGILQRLRKSGQIEHETGKDRNRHTRIFVRVAHSKLRQSTSPDGKNVFH